MLDQMMKDKHSDGEYITALVKALYSLGVNPHGRVFRERFLTK